MQCHFILFRRWQQLLLHPSWILHSQRRGRRVRQIDGRFLIKLMHRSNRNALNVIGVFISFSPFRLRSTLYCNFWFALSGVLDKLIPIRNMLSSTSARPPRPNHNRFRFAVVRNSPAIAEATKQQIHLHSFVILAIISTWMQLVTLQPPNGGDARWKPRKKRFWMWREWQKKWSKRITW